MPTLSAPCRSLRCLAASQVLANKARDKRLAKRELKIKLNWILRKKSKGF